MNDRFSEAVEGAADAGAARGGTVGETRDIAARFVRARLGGVSLQEFPGQVPTSLDAAYDCQDAAIASWPDRVQGWKVGRILEPWLSRFGEDRLVGPIFAGGVRTARASQVVEFPVFEGGFAAVEAEFVVRLGADAPASKTDWTAAEAGGCVAAMHVGVETAGSPLAMINALGPPVVVSDFGNNAGLIVGPEIPNWRGFAPDQLSSETFIEGQRVGTGTAASVPGGPLAGLAFALNRCARRGLPLKAGQFVSTGATTGIHDIRIGQGSRVVFSGVAEIECRAVRARPMTRTEAPK
jgi:2-keto-4-pentenoate hydratase